MGRSGIDTRTQQLPRRTSAARLAVPAAEDGFKLVRRDGFVMIIPSPVGKHKASDWAAAERIFRSCVVREETGEVVSVGFPKFFNLGEDAGDTEILEQALACGEPVFFTDKLDGSLGIRSVVDGEVWFRTRGSLDGGPHGVAMRKLAAERYPVLLDPEFMPGHSLLFEFVSPQFRIVLPYPEDDLILIGAVDHSTLRLADVPELELIARENKLPLVDLVELPTEPAELVAAVSALAGKEGVVARTNAGQTLVKLKGADYLARHRLRFALSTRVIRETCLELDVRDLAGFERYLAEQGGDWELVQDARPLVELFISTRQTAAESFAELEREVAAKLEQLPERKAFAVEYATKLAQPQQAAAFMLASGRRDAALVMFEQKLLEQAFAEAESADDALLEDE